MVHASASSSTSSSSKEEQSASSSSHSHDAAADSHRIDNDDGDDDDDSRKIFLSRIPQSFNEEIITRILETKFGTGCVVNVSIVYDKTENGGAAAAAAADKNKKSGNKHDDQQPPAHRGFAFVTFLSSSKCQEAILAETVRGSSAKSASTPSKQRKHTMYIRPVLRDDTSTEHTTNNHSTRTNDTTEHDENNSKDICFLWTKHRCPYGEKCKFIHVGEGGCVSTTTTTTYYVDAKHNDGAATTGTTTKKKHCFNFKKNGKCKNGDDCPFLHDIHVSTTHKKHKEEAEDENKNKDKSQIMCINWKNKGKCRKGDKCPYRHGNSDNNDKNEGSDAGNMECNADDGMMSAPTIEKKEKKRKPKDKSNKNRQSLSIRIFGLNYNTTPDDVRALLQNCGPIMELTFPTFEDSGRSKGYCGVLFQSPKAVEKAVLLDGCELHDRWLPIQEGKMYLRKWEEVENDRRREDCWGKDDDDVKENDGEKEIVIGEFGQRVKKRKKHGYKD